METEQATALVSLLVSHGSTTVGYVQSASLTEWWTEAGWDTHEIYAALEGAGELNWIESGAEPGSLVLTEAGYSAGGGIVRADHLSA